MIELGVEVEEVKFLVVLGIFRIIVSAVSRVISLGLILGLQMINLQLLIVNVESRLAKLLLYDLVLFLSPGHVHHTTILSVEMPKNLGVDPALDFTTVFLKQAFSCNFDNKADRDVIGAATDGEEAEVFVELG